MQRVVLLISFTVAFLGVGFTSNTAMACGTKCVIIKVSKSENLNCCSIDSAQEVEDNCCNESDKEKDCNDCNCCPHGSFSTVAFAEFTFVLDFGHLESRLPLGSLPLYHYTFNHEVWQPPQISE